MTIKSKILRGVTNRTEIAPHRSAFTRPSVNRPTVTRFSPRHKPRAKQFLIDELGWRDYGGKHHESIFTRFYQGYILPRKFDVDKRKAHLSSLILSGQATREEALAELQQPTYDERLQQQDKIYVAKKLGFTPEEFEVLLTQPNRRHEEFGTDEAQRRWYFKGTRAWGALRRMIKKPFDRA